MSMATATTRAMVMVTSWWVTKRAMVRVARAIAIAMRIGAMKRAMANGGGNESGGQQRG